MKTYKDLVFQEHALAKEANQHKTEMSEWLYKESKNAKHAVLCFENGYGISVIKDCPFLTGNWKYECAVLKGTEEHYHMVYPKFTDGDVMRMNTQKEINELMKKIQEIPTKKD